MINPFGALYRGLGRDRPTDGLPPQRLADDLSHAARPGRRTATVPGPASSAGLGALFTVPDGTAPSTSWSHSAARSAPTSATACMERVRPGTGFHAAHRASSRRRDSAVAPNYRSCVSSRAGRPVRVCTWFQRLIRALDGRRGARRRLHRPGPGHIGCRLDRAGPDVGAVGRRGPTFRYYAPPRQRGTHQQRAPTCATPCWSSPTPSRPRTKTRVVADESWKTICEVGQRVDERLAAAGS